jgi:3-methyladenine DNA glycosylase AlkD
MQRPYAETKLAAILYLQLYGKLIASELLLNAISDWYNRGYIADWNVGDWLCVRLLSPLLDKEKNNVLAPLERWNQNKYLWKARASLVSFAVCKKIGTYPNEIERFSITLIHRPERFCKAAVSWVLREYSKVDSETIKNFLDKYKSLLIPKITKNTTQY